MTFRRLYFRSEYTWQEGEGSQYLRIIILVWWDSHIISNTNALLSEFKITDTNLSTEPLGNSNLYKLGSAKAATFLKRVSVFFSCFGGIAYKAFRKQKYFPIFPGSVLPA